MSVSELEADKDAMDGGIEVLVGCCRSTTGQLTKKVACRGCEQEVLTRALQRLQMSESQSMESRALTFVPASYCGESLGRSDELGFPY